MVTDNEKTLVCRVVEEQQTITLGQLCRSCGVDAEWVTLLVEHGIIEPEGGVRGEPWQFRTVYLRRVHTALRLQRDLSLNVPGVALALELIDEIDDLQQRLKALAEH